MCGKSFTMGIGVGIAAGAMLGTVLMPQKKGSRGGSGKMMRNIGEIIDNIVGMIG